MNDYGVLTAPDTLRIERIMPGPIERVWDYLTDSEKRGTWLATGVMELKNNGKVEHIFRNCSLTADDDEPPEKYAHCRDEQRLNGQITACKPPHLLSYIWNQGGGEESEVCFELASKGEQVLLTLTHRRLLTRDTMISVAAGWHTHLAILIAHLNEQKPEGFWRNHTRLEAEYDKRFFS
jgi:uncharacterized protein YndB with AHSA1/START domain